jgi:hypothetical protein
MKNTACSKSGMTTITYQTSEKETEPWIKAGRRGNKKEISFQ